MESGNISNYTTFFPSLDETEGNFSYQIFGTGLSCELVMRLNITMQMSHLSSLQDWTNPAQDHVYEVERVHYISCMFLLVIHSLPRATRPIRFNLKVYQCSMWDSGFYETLTSNSLSGSAPCPDMSTRTIVDYGQTCMSRFHYSIGTYFNDEVECQCDMYCHEFSDCCLNVNDIDQEVYGYPEYLEKYHLDLKGRNENLREIMGCVSNQIPPLKRTHSLGYFMVIDCPFSESHSLVKDHCTQSVSREELTLFHFIPVEVKYIVYRNVFCAWCHGITRLHESSFWGARFDDTEECYELLEKVKRFQPIPFSQLETECISSSLGFFGPFQKKTLETLNIFDGDTRMGKVCILPDGVQLAKQALVQNAEMKPEGSSPHSLQYYECKRAISTEMTSQNKGFNVLIVKGGVLTKTDHVCAACSVESFMYLFSNYLPMLYSILIPWSSNTIDGRISVLFDQGEILDCSTFDSCEQKATKASSNVSYHVQIAMSHAGCFFSLASLCTCIHIFKFRGDFCSSEPKRVQFLLILSKIAFFSTFAVGYYFHAVYSVCKIVGMVLHYTVLVSFASSILFGAKVMTMLLRMKYDMAALAKENRDDRKMSRREVAQYVGIWGSILVSTVLFGVYEFALDGDFFGYGQYEICFITKQKALLYAFVVPTSVTVGANILTTIISVCLYFSVSKNHPGNTFLAQSILSFFGRLLVFQSVQWIFGIGCYFSSNEVVAFIFSFLTAFEGVFIYIGVFTSKG